MADKNLPHIPIYIGDWERDCNVLSLQAEMAWMKIIFKMHLSGKQSSYKVSAKGLQRLWKSTPAEVEEILKELRFEDICEITEISGGFEFTSRRFKKENQISEVRSEAAKSRWEKEKEDANNMQTSNKNLQNPDNDIDNDNDNDFKNENDIEKKVVEIFNSICKDLPKVQKLTKSRKSAINARIKEYQPEDSEIFFESIFRKVQKNRFLTGINDRGWTADFDWILKAANTLKILEGKYDEKGKPTQQTGSQYSDEWLRKKAEILTGSKSG